jgi:hypothetical protein
MKKKKNKLCPTDMIIADAGDFLLNLFTNHLEAAAHEHGGWEEVPDEIAKAMLSLGEDAAAVAIRDGFISWLMTEKGLNAVKCIQEPHYEWALEHFGEE